MSEPSPNTRQQELITNTDGVYLVDAGPGTGKTFTITRRYAEIVDQAAIEPDDVLLVTFTRSAATEMKERIVDHSEYGARELADAPIQTFHSHCHDLLQEHGHTVPTHLGLDERITGSTTILEDELVEAERFREFSARFRDDHPEHAAFVRVVDQETELLELIRQLAAKGIFPTTEGWYRDGESQLDGDFETFGEQFDAVNQPRNNGSKQSELRDSLSRFGSYKTYLPEAPEKAELRGERGTKQLDRSVARDVFESDRSQLKEFVHDVYVEYLAFALGRNYLNFGFLQLFAYVLLREDETVRNRATFEYVMVDEFQDTSEVQFKLALLLAGTDNLCVVGDWKQSIYSFQYADVRNILDFEQRLDAFAAELDDNGTCVSFDGSAVETIELKQNYRSTQEIIDFSEDALITPATSNEEVVAETLDDVVALESNKEFDATRFEARQHEDEPEAVLSLVQEIVDNEAYAVEDENGEPRRPSYEDIAVFTRTRDYGRELIEVADEYNLPVAYDGGVELLRSDPAKLLLAWLRILDANLDRGWAVVLERAGYTLDEIDHILETEGYPTDMQDFRSRLQELNSVGAVARRVFDRYGIEGASADVLLHTIQSAYDTSTATRGDLIRFIEQGIEEGSVHEVHTSAGKDSVTVQTIHAAKGLEYPIVILANMNEGRFPPSSRNSLIIQYHESVGLRQRKQYADVGEYPHVYDNWRYDVIRHCLPQDYDEERRLLYVALTRAEQHLCFVGGETPNTFLKELDVEIESPEPTVSSLDASELEQAELPFAVVTPDGPVSHSPHSLMDETVFEDGPGQEASVDVESTQRGMDFGSKVHEFAEAYALGEDVTASNDHEQRITSFLDGLTGELHVEENVVLPLSVDGQQVSIRGVVDLVHVTDETVEIVDYKTDESRRAEEAYRTQLSVYYHVLSEWFETRQVTASLFYTGDDEIVEIEPIAEERIKAAVRDAGL